MAAAAAAASFFNEGEIDRALRRRDIAARGERERESSAEKRSVPIRGRHDPAVPENGARKGRIATSLSSLFAGKERPGVSSPAGHFAPPREIPAKPLA
jgi:hypothetical protein